MNTRSRPSRFSLRLFAGWFGFVLYAAASSPLGLGLAAGLGLLDRDHRVGVQAGAETTRLVLHHDQRGAAHHQGTVARVLTLFADATQPGEPDHVLQFNVSDSFSHPRQFIAPSPAQVDQPAFAVVGALAWSPREVFVSQVPTHPPPSGSGSLLCLRSTLLLI